MRIDVLQAFVAVADLGSFNEAARRLHLSQPGISKRLASLEARVGHRLLNRVGRRITLTEAGRAYLPHARQTLAALADGDRALDNMADRIEGQLTIALSHHVGMHRIPAVLQRYIAAHPAVQPQIVFADSESACDRVANGESELAVITLPDTHDTRLITQPIWHDHLGLYVGRHHALAADPTPTLADIATCPGVLPPTGSHTYAVIEAAFHRAGFRLATRMSSHSLETLRMLADVGLGWTVLPTAMPHDLVALPADSLAMTRTLGVVRHPQRQLSNAARALLTMLEAERAGSANHS